jgi:protein PhnA
MCEMDDVLAHSTQWECVTYGHEWEREAYAEIPSSPRIVKDAHGNLLADGDSITLIKDLPLKGSSQSSKAAPKRRTSASATAITRSPARSMEAPSV